MSEMKFKDKKYKCPCCGYYTLDVMEGHDTPFFEICEVCGWMYDEVDQEHPDRAGGNHISFNEAKENYKKFGRVREDLDFCRPSLESELPENNGEEVSGRTIYPGNQLAYTETENKKKQVRKKFRDKLMGIKLQLRNIKKWLKWIIILIAIIVFIVLYMYFTIIGISISEPAKEMAKPIPLDGEILYLEDNLKNQENLVLSICMGLGTHAINKPSTYQGDFKPLWGASPKCMVEIHSNGWMKIFYAKDQEIDGMNYPNYAFVGRKFLLLPTEYKELIDMAEAVTKTTPTAKSLIDENREYFMDEKYPAYYSYGEEGMPCNWEEDSPVENAPKGRIFYKGHWYMYDGEHSSATGLLVEKFRESNSYIIDQTVDDIETEGYSWWGDQLLGKDIL